MDALRALPSDLARSLALRSLRQRAPDEFHRLLLTHAEELLPVVYTPTIGEVAARYHALPLQPQGVYISADDAGHVAARLAAAAPRLADAAVVVITDGERVLGLGDLGAGGLAISEGKILLYTVFAGLPPHHCLPLCLDVGTENEALLADPGYKGLRRRRLRAAAYTELVDEVVGALRAARAGAPLLLQWEDFGSENAFQLLERHRLRCAPAAQAGSAALLSLPARTAIRVCSFNDDIQGTAAVVLAGLLSALRAAAVAPPTARLLFLGAGEAGTGIGELWALYLHRRHGVALHAARLSCAFMDSQGLVCERRPGKPLAAHKLPFAQPQPHTASLLDAIRRFRPTALLGVAAQSGAFGPAELAQLALHAPRPIVMPLSNPTSLAECTAEEAFQATGGRCLFASGSPFPPLRQGHRSLQPSQANNAYIFPALGLGALLSRAVRLSDDTFLAAAEALAARVSDEMLQRGELFPPFQAAREASAAVAAAVAARCVEEGAGVEPAGLAAAGGWEALARQTFWSPPALPLPAKL